MSFWRELKHRKVFQVAAVYAVTAWLLVQVIVAVEAPLGLPAWADTLVIVLLAIGFPVALILSWAFDVTPDGIRPARPRERDGASPRRAAAFSYLSQGLVLVAVGFLVVDQYVLAPVSGGSDRPATTDVLRYRHGLADAERLVPTPGVSIAVAPDGGRIVYVGPAADGRQLWIREKDQLRSTPLPGTEGALDPFFAPDGRRVGFVTADGQLKVIPRFGDAPITLVDDGVIPADGAAWGADGRVYFSTAAGLMRLMATGGGAPEPVAPVDSTTPAVLGHALPDLLPNGKGALFTIVRNHLPSDVAVVDFSTGDTRVLAQGVLARYAASGHLVYVREDGGLMAAPFDQERLAMSGQAVLLGDRLPVGTPPPDLALSTNGRLLYATRPRRTLEAVWVERDGTWRSIDADNPIDGVRYVALSPDETRLVVTTWTRPPSDDGHLWIKELPNGPFSRFTFEGQVNMRPSWSPDGRSVVFISDRAGDRDVWLKRADGTRPAEVLLDGDVTIDEALYSLNGEWIVHRRGMQDGERDILAVRATDGDTVTPLVTSEFDEVAPALSPDGRWLAYVSDRGGQPNVYVRPFPDADAETLVSVNGGVGPVWARDRPELYYRSGAGDLVAVPVLPGEEFTTAPAEVLFSATAYRNDFYHATYDVTADGERFVMIRVSDTGSLEEELIGIENWFEELDRLVPTRLVSGGSARTGP